MGYLRVIPRDLFNEAKLLKCLGALYICSERLPEGAITLEHNDKAFDIQQDPSDGSIFVDNIRVLVYGKSVHVYTSMNSRAPYPLWYNWGDETDAVFNDDGTLSKEFLAIIERAKK